MKKLEEDMKNFFGRFPAKTFANDACQIFGAYCSIGIVKTEDGIVGDVDFESVKNKVGKITPVPGGVGPVTVACSLINMIKTFKNCI